MAFLLDLIQLVFPATCCACGQPLIGQERHLCTHCLLHLEQSYYTHIQENPVEQLFFGRLPIESATSLLRFRSQSITQRVVHSIKYYGNVPLAHTMGRLLGQALADSHRFDSVDLLVPVPLHPLKQRKRGYNQSLELCRGIANTFPRPIDHTHLIRDIYTETQTHKSHNQRSENVHDAFFVPHPQAFIGHHILLVDDVLTTGSTIEFAARQIAHLPRTRLSIATLAHAVH